MNDTSSLYQAAVKEKDAQKTLKLLELHVNSISNHRVSRLLKKVLTRAVTEDSLDVASIILHQAGHKVKPYIVGQIIGSPFLSDSPTKMQLHLKSISLVLNFIKKSDNFTTEMISKIIYDVVTQGKGIPNHIILYILATVSNILPESSILKMLDIVFPEEHTSLFLAVINRDLDDISTLLTTNKNVTSQEVISTIIRFAAIVKGNEISDVMLYHYEGINIPELECNTYHDIVTSLDQQTDWGDDNNVDKSLYTKILTSNYLPIVSDVLYTNSIDKAHHIVLHRIDNPVRGTMSGYYLAGTSFVYYQNSRSLEYTLIHEEIHKFADVVCGSQAFFYTNQVEKILYEQTIRRTLYKILHKLYAINVYSDLDALNTWQVGKKLLELYKAVNYIPYSQHLIDDKVCEVDNYFYLQDLTTENMLSLCNISKQESQIYNGYVNHDLQHKLDNMFVFYEYYTELREHGEFITYLFTGSILEKECDADIQDIRSFALQYWQNIIVPKIHEHWEHHDLSKFCVPIMSSLDSILIGNEKQCEAH